MQLHQKSQTNKRSLVLMISALVISAAAVIMCLSGCPGAPVNCAELPDPQNTVKAFFDQLGQGNYSECDSFLMDFTVGDMEHVSDGEMVREMQSMLVESYSYKLNGNSEISALTARQSVSVSYLDLSSFGSAVKDEANRIAEDLSHQGINVHSEDKAAEIAFQSLKAMSANASSYCTSNDILIELMYVDGEWKIMYNSDIERMIMGKRPGQ